MNVADAAVQVGVATPVRASGPTVVTPQAGPLGSGADVPTIAATPVPLTGGLVTTEPSGVYNGSNGLLQVIEERELLTLVAL